MEPEGDFPEKNFSVMERFFTGDWEWGEGDSIRKDASCDGRRNYACC